MRHALLICAALALGCGEEEAAARETAETAEVEEAPEVEAPEPAPGGLVGTIEGEPFSARGVLARRAPGDAIELRIFSRAVDCARFREDYRLAEGEKVVTVFLRWPKAAGDTIALRASETQDRLQFCRGRASGFASCEPRAPEQGSLTVVEASPEAGALTFDVSSDAGELSGRLDFALCP